MNDECDFVDTEQAIAAFIHRMCADPLIRRELLWLRAMENEDEATARDLEAIQPGLREHMRELVSEFVERGNRLDTPSECRAGYGRLHDERYDYYEKLLLREVG
jgi:hypothetical protein